MSVENLDKIFQPKSIAVVGASERKGSVGAALIHNLIERGFSGQILPVNSNHKKIGKLPSCPSIRDLEAPVDLAIISTPITSVPQIIKDCVDVGVGGAVIISAGGKEIGEQGKKLEMAIQKEGFRYVTATAVAPDRHPGMLPGASELKVKLVFADRSGTILGGQVSGGPSAGELINMIALAIQKKVTVRELDMLQIATHPLLTSAPTVHPVINAAHQALAKLRATVEGEHPTFEKAA